MCSHGRLSALRWTLFALLLALPITVVCKNRNCTDCEAGADPAEYEASFGCNGGSVSVVAGTVSDSAGIDDCFAGKEASAASVIDGVAARVDFLVQHGGGSVTLTCAYDIAADLSNDLTCAGETRRPANFFYLDGFDPVQYEIKALVTSLADGADTGSFDPHVFVECPGAAETEIAFGDDGYRTPELPPSNTDCGIRVVMNSAASAAGATVHSVTLSLRSLTSCNSDADCAIPLRCSSSGICQNGGVGDSCTSSHIPATGGGDCNSSAPICVSGPGIVAPRCSNGSDGSGCAGNFQCAGSANCIEYFLGLGLCQDGSVLDLCHVDAECDAGCDCVNLGGSLGNCLGGCVPPGDVGSFCATAAECQAGLGCVDFGVQSICYQCSVDADCDVGETCAAGACSTP